MREEAEEGLIRLRDGALVLRFTTMCDVSVDRS